MVKTIISLLLWLVPLYPSHMTITHIQAIGEESAYITLTDSCGRTFTTLTAIEDWQTGDGVSVIMYDSGKKGYALDDEVMIMRYSND